MAEPLKVTLTLNQLRLLIESYVKEACAVQRGMLITNDQYLLDKVHGVVDQDEKP